MFNNTLNLASTSDALQNVGTAILDGPNNRKTVRGSADGKTILTIAHGESNENPGFVTQRSNVRNSLLKEVGDTGKSISAYAQLTISFVKEEVTAAELQTLISQLVNFLILAENTGNDEAVVTASQLITTVSRLAAGEP